MSRTAIVTGGASGIGLALSAALAGQGYRVVVADLDVDAAGRAAAGLGPDATGAGLDVRDEGAVHELVRRTEAAHGLHLMVNNAGISVLGWSEELTGAHWARQLGVNLWGVIHGVNAAYPLMKARGSGQILNTASIAGLIPSPGLNMYSTSKFAVVGLTLALRAEAAGFGVKVSALCPGFVDTPLLDQTNPADLPATGVTVPSRGLVATFGVGRPTTPEAVAAAAVAGLRRNHALIVTPASAA
ncbi:MAG: SDR family oxidoreductase, partial [Actinomycetota bacterium]|nr:SDR family oxidoreductase [Actinomycetota bacterium]